METTFVINQDELNEDFLESLKKLFKYRKQLQITVTAPEDFNLLHSETPAAYITRLEKRVADINEGKNTITFTELQLDDIILEAL
jgi:hypothetical protein